MTADFPIPAGYALVPLEPTEAMVEAAKDERMACFKDTALSVGAALARIYKAAVAAAPPIAATGEDLKIYQAIADNYHATAAVVGEPVAESASAFKSRLITDACSKWSGAQKVEAGDIVEWIADYRVAPSPATDPAATLIEALLAVQMSAVAIPDVAGEHAIKTATLAKVERALGAYSLSVPAKDRKRLPVTVCCGRSECGGECGNEWAGMEDARLVGRYRDALAMLAAPAVARPAPRAPLPLMHQAFRTTETMGVPECIYRMIFGFPSLAALQAAEAEWIALDRAARALTQGDVSASAAEVKASANLVRSAACNWGSDDPETKRRSASLEIAIDRLAALAGAQAPGAMKWQPIETAPKDGREVLLAVSLRAGISGKSLVGHYMEGGHCIEDHPPIDAGWYFWNGHQFDRAAKPTHWMALPATPGADQ